MNKNDLIDDVDDVYALYQEVIIDHSQHPRHCHCMTDASHQADGYNPLCGDNITLYLTVKDNCITDASFQGQGCAISTASASLLTECIIGKTTDEALSLFERFHRVVTDKQQTDDTAQLGKLMILAGVKAYPARVKCATLAWHTLQAALTRATQPATTE